MSREFSSPMVSAALVHAQLIACAANGFANIGGYSSLLYLLMWPPVSSFPAGPRLSIPFRCLAALWSHCSVVPVDLY